MIKNLMILMASAAILVSCGGNCEHAEGDTKEVKEEKVIEKEVEKTVEAVVVAPADFEAKAGELVGKKIQMEGTAVHICSHGGKRLFIGDENDNRIKITTGENMTAFDKEWEGSTVKVIGTIDELRIDEDYLNEWEAEINEVEDAHEAGKEVHTGEAGHEDHSKEDKMAQINDYREQIKETEKGYLSFYSIVCEEIEKLD